MTTNHHEGDSMSTTADREAVALRLLRDAWSADFGDDYWDRDDDALPWEMCDLAPRYIYVSTNNEGEWAANVSDSMGLMYENARCDVYQDNKYAWWPMYVLDLDEQTHHKIEVVTRITIGGVEG